MYNLNVNVNPNQGVAAGLLSVAAAELTPRTPEIVNSLMNMTNPFEGFQPTPGEHCGRDRKDSSSSGEPSPPSIQFTRSQLIKEGLKLTLQTKRQANGSGDDGKKKTRKEDGSADDEEDDESSNSKSNGGLTPEDEERRRRRRERNKIAATKCRLKKREKTVILVQESETLETQNHELKTQIQELEQQRRKLVDMLNLHGPNCIKQPPCIDTSMEQYGEPMQPLPSYQENFVPSMNPMGHHQPGQADCAVISGYSPVKLEGYDAVAQDFYRQGSPYATTTTTNSDASCTV